MSRIRGKHNKTTETTFRMALVRLGIKKWQMHADTLPGRPDFVFRAARLAVFVDGCFWHGCPKCGHIPNTRRPFWAAKIARNIRRDYRNKRLLRVAGWRVLRFWEHQVCGQMNMVILELQASLKQRGS